MSRSDGCGIWAGLFQRNSIDGLLYTKEPFLVKLRAVHLLRKLETIERDLLELDTLQDRIREDRVYADRLRSSLVEESVRLRNLKSRILSQVIRNPPEVLRSLPRAQTTAATTDNAPSTQAPPEIILPGKAAPSARKTAPVPGTDPEPEPKKATRPAKDRPRAQKGQDEPESFEFRYE